MVKWLVKTVFNKSPVIVIGVWWAVESTHQQRLPVDFNVYPNGLNTIHRQVRPFNGGDTITNVNCYSSPRPAYYVTTEWGGGGEIGEFKIIGRNIGRKPGF